MFNPNEAKRYSKQTILDEVGLLGQAKLKNARVVVIGAGGLGCPIIQYLASCGVGTIGIVDFDVIEHSNLHRQILYTPQDVGRKKADVAKVKALAQNPDTVIEIFDSALNTDNAEFILSQFDLVIDGCDNFLTRYTVNDVCVELNRPLIYGSILGFQGQLAVFNVNGSKNLRDLFPEPPNAEDVPNCSDNGVLGVVPGVIGTLMANEALKCILGLEINLNTFHVFDLLSLEMTKLRY
ncbi:HesA/MoeB/ThiF family protein [Fluviicola taffensis]|uniref:Molybdopterin-synthase adenylyltransferase n=1 Tax=Fluviicola taffensis (strain DSM 16823 / NCIMB 13979 / RW262) TaxID=755732 RepID=F2IHL1_FLUTR|nr:HesA/MoeB/ThiF family protein [Fluviicola taffensis]AEA44789.1 UBA/THIF-type NAD/FAD binding protein [Fluviicola taffensis DSM 16823]